MRASRSLALAAGILLTASGRIWAAPITVASDAFGDGDRDNNGTLDGPVENAADVGLKWFKARAGSILLPIVADPDDANGANGAEINSGNALDFSAAASTSNRPVVTNFGMQSLADGQSLTVSFDWRIYNLTTASDRGIRFGIYNSNSTPITADQSSATLADDDRGYLFRSDTGTPAGNTADFQYNTVQFGGGTLFSLGASTSDVNWGMDDNDKHHMIASLTRSGSDILVSVQMDSLTPITGTHLSTAATPATTYAFDELMFTQNTSDVDFRVDNVLIQLSEIPEPGTLSMLALIAIPALARRRKQ